MPDIRLECRLASACRAELDQRTAQAAQVGLLPAWRWRAESTTIKIDQVQAVRRHQHIMGIEIGMPDAGSMKPGDQLTDHGSQAGIKPPRRQVLGQGLRPGNAASDQVGPIEQAPPDIARRDHDRTGQTQPIDLGEQAKFHEGARALRTSPEIAIPDQGSDQAAATVMPQHAFTSRGFDDGHAAATTRLRAQGPAFAPVIRHKPVMPDLWRHLGVEQNRASGVFVHPFLHHHAL